ncbi:MAG: ribonuclease D [Woeseiaceae bacterium]|nr:ribonuclease D [Woeseiaceae bacterium]
MPAFTLVDRVDQLADRLESLTRIGVDTEFMRERTYFSQLCLLQVSTPDHIYCIDPLGNEDLADTWAMLSEREWVLHSARQDIEVIYQTTERMPATIFDTQVAAALLGFQPQIGYSGLVQELFDVELPKSHTRADWSKRPLPDEFLEYAAEDVEYLLPAYDELAGRLEARGRLNWAIEDSKLLLDKRLYDIDPNAAVDRLKGARNLRGRRRSVAAALASWRESEALRRNRPRQWILRDNVVINIAYAMPESTSALARVEDMPGKLVSRAGKEIVRVVGEASKNGSDYKPPRPPDEAQKSLLKKMQAAVQECAADLGLAAEIIASRKELSGVIIGGNRQSRVFGGWRRDLIGGRLQELLEAG